MIVLPNTWPEFINIQTFAYHFFVIFVALDGVFGELHPWLCCWNVYIGSSKVFGCHVAWGWWNFLANIVSFNHAYPHSATFLLHCFSINGTPFRHSLNWPPDLLLSTAFAPLEIHFTSSFPRQRGGRTFLFRPITGCLRSPLLLFGSLQPI